MNRSKEVMRMASRRNSKGQIIICFLIILTFGIYQYFISVKSNGENDEEEFSVRGHYKTEIIPKVLRKIRPKPFNGEKLIHLDLKGAPPLVSYYQKFFPYIKGLGATGVLIEYEDMFHYSEELEDIRALNAYTPSEVETILKTAEVNNLQVIPLVQTFGHFEFVLKLEKYKELREIETFPQVLCPSHEKVHSVIHKMIDQVLKAHPKAKYIHIGSDEVMFLGKCDKCKKAQKENGWNDYDLFISHVRSVAQYINKTYSNVRPIIWGDMITKTNKNKLQKSQIPDLVDLMVWTYSPDVSYFITNKLLKMYARLFKSIWIASAFKGATGVSQMTTDAKYHLQNHMAWMDIVQNWKETINFKGIALTGWQRYDHFSTLCELLPVAIPSLTISMNYISNSEQEFIKPARILRCSSEENLRSDYCNFPGLELYTLIHKFYSFSLKVQEKFSIRSSGWFSVYNVVHKFSSPLYVQEMFNKLELNEQLNDLYKLEKNLVDALSQVYDVYTVKEWIMTNLTPLRIRLEAFSNAKEAVLEQTVWPRRPLVNNTGDLEKAADQICAFDRNFGCALLMV